MSLNAIMFCPQCHWYTRGEDNCPRCGVSLAQPEAPQAMAGLPVFEEIPPAVEKPLPMPMEIPPAVEQAPPVMAEIPPAVKKAPQPVNREDFVILNGVLTQYNGSAKEVEIPAGVRVVGANAFAGNKRIEWAVLPQGVEEIAGKAFWQCDRLAYVRILPSVKTISMQAFASAVDPRYPITSRVGLPALYTVEMTPAQWRKYYNLFPRTQEGKRLAQQKKWRELNLCQHCGGRIAFLTAQCKNCGKMKDY